jgi:hypothetical protein
VKRHGSETRLLNLQIPSEVWFESRVLNPRILGGVWFENVLKKIDLASHPRHNELPDMEPPKLTLTPEAQRIVDEIALIKRERLERRLERQRLKSCGPKTPAGKAIAAANNQARSPVWAFQGTSAQVRLFIGGTLVSEHRAGIEAALTSAGLPFKQVKLSGYWKIRAKVMAVTDRGWVRVHIVGKARPWTRYCDVVGEYCQSVLEGRPV